MARWSRVATFVLPVLLPVFALTATTVARAQWTTGQSVFTTDGVEVGVDARVFSLFALLNSLGYDVDEARGPAPLFRPQFSDARKKVRAALSRPGAAAKQLTAVLDKNPVPVDT